MSRIFKWLKFAYRSRFIRKPVTWRIKRILCWSLGLILAALLLGGHFTLTFVFATLTAICYLTFILRCKKMESISECVAKRTADDMRNGLNAKNEKENNV